SAFTGVRARSAAVELGLLPTTPVAYLPAGGSTVKGERYVLALIEALLGTRPDLAFFLSGAVSPVLRAELAAAGLGTRVYAPGPLAWHDNLALVAGCRVGVAPSLAENLS